MTDYPIVAEGAYKNVYASTKQFLHIRTIGISQEGGTGWGIPKLSVLFGTFIPALYGYTGSVVTQDIV